MPSSPVARHGVTWLWAEFLYIVMDDLHMSGIYKAIRLKWGTVSLGLQGFQGCWERASGYKLCEVMSWGTGMVAENLL